jgi:hypothetical protein
VDPLKEKVERLAKGVFEYETPNILLSEEEIIITVVSGKTYNGSITIKNNNDTPIKGILYSSGELLVVQQNRFTDIENIIGYCFSGENMNPGETWRGSIYLVTDCGELQIPVTATAEAPFVNSSLGKIKDLFNFTNLAKADWTEATKLFKSDEFRRVIKHHDSNYLVTYENLVKSRSISCALEEFLIAIHKKLKINFSVNKSFLTYQMGKESVMDKLVLTKDNWGYSELRISTDAPFIHLEHKIIWTDNFVGNTYPLEFVLDPSAMGGGNNYGRIFIKNTYQTMVIELTCMCKKQGYNLEQSRRSIKEHQINLVNNYINFRTNKISVTTYVANSTSDVETLSAMDEKNYAMYQLIRTHLTIISGKENQVESMLKDLNKKSEQWKENSIMLYLGYLYLIAMYRKDDISIENAIVAIRNHYDRESDDWRGLWLLLFLDSKYDYNKSAKLSDIKKQYELGCTNPILYFEALLVMNEDPSLLYELGPFELQIMNFGIKQNYVTEDVAMQYNYLAGKMKHFSRMVHANLTRLYEMHKKKEILTTICSLLIKGHQRHIKYFRWFKLGVEEQLRITELHEYFMYTLDENWDMVLPTPILLYFIYNSNLNDRKRAYLYSYIIKNKDELATIYGTYSKRIEQYAMKQLLAHNISNHLSTLYDELILIHGITEEIATHLPNVLFKYQIESFNPNVKGVYVVHKEAEDEVYYPLVNGTALIDIYTEDAELFLVDGFDNRYTTTIDYTLNKLMTWEDYIGPCYELYSEHPMLLLNLHEKARNYQKYDPVSIDLRKRILEIEGLRESYYQNNIIELIYYYYDNFQGELLESYLKQIKLKGLKKEERDRIIEFYIIRDMYEEGISALGTYGFQGIAVNRLIKLCTYFLQKKKDDEAEKSEILVELSYYIFKEGKYNDSIIEYLVKYYFGTTAQMFELWKAAVAFEVSTITLEERLLAQMLFSDSYVVNSFSVFLQYYNKGANHKLIKGFLSYNAYKYLVKERVIQPELFDIMKREVAYEENEICMLALLKELSARESLSEGEVDLIDYNIHKFANKGIVLPFFKEFRNKVSLPPKLMNKCYVEYITNPKHKVLIHYRMDYKDKTDDKEEFITEEMKDIYMGIRVKDFILFHNESIQYYVTEEDTQGQVTITESVTIRLEHNLQVDEESKYNQINFMLSAITMQDETSLMDSLSNYVKNNYVISKLFKPL